MPGGRLTQQDRERIAAGLSYAEIARRVDRSTSTISREVGRNGGPGGYRPQEAHHATARRARRGTPAPPRAVERPVGAVASEIIEPAVRSGMPRMAARVHVDLLLSEGGRRTAAETLGPDSPVAQRLARAGTFLERVVEDMQESADRWRSLLT